MWPDETRTLEELKLDKVEFTAVKWSVSNFTNWNVQKSSNRRHHLHYNQIKTKISEAVARVKWHNQIMRRVPLFVCLCALLTPRNVVTVRHFALIRCNWWNPRKLTCSVVSIEIIRGRVILIWLLICNSFGHMRFHLKSDHSAIRDRSPQWSTPPASFKLLSSY